MLRPTSVMRSYDAGVLTAGLLVLGRTCAPGYVLINFMSALSKYTRTAVNVSGTSTKRNRLETIGKFGNAAKTKINPKGYVSILEPAVFWAGRSLGGWPSCWAGRFFSTFFSGAAAIRLYRGTCPRSVLKNEELCFVLPNGLISQR